MKKIKKNIFINSNCKKFTKELLNCLSEEDVLNKYEL